MELYPAIIFGLTAIRFDKIPQSIPVLLSSRTRGVIRSVSSSETSAILNFTGILLEFCRTHVSVNGNIPVKGIALYHCTLLGLSYILT
jgi:hypothetical protein